MPWAWAVQYLDAGVNVVAANAAMGVWDAHPKGEVLKLSEMMSDILGIYRDLRLRLVV